MNGVERMHGEDVAIDLKGLMAAIWRAKRWILPTTVVVGVATALVLSLMTPKYLGQAKVLIEANKAVFAEAQQEPRETERALLDQEGVASQVQLLTSRDLARRVAKKLKLAERSEFNPAGKGGGSLVNDMMVLLGLARDPLRVSPEERVLDAYFERLKVYQIERSRVIVVEFTSKDRELSANAPNAIVAEYLALQAVAKRTKTEDAAVILEPEIAKLRDEVTEAERRVEEFRAGADLLVGSNNLTLAQQQLGELTTQLATARSRKTEAETKARSVRSLIVSGASLDSSTDVLASRLIQRLRERQVTLKAQLAELSTTLLPNHPRIKALKSQLADFDRQIRSEARKVLAGLEHDAKVAAERVRSLKAGINELKAQSASANSEQVKLRELQRDAEAKSRRLTTLLARYREADSGRNALTLPADARLISRATIPSKPSWPKVFPITVIATLATFILSVSFVVIGEFVNGNALRSVVMPETETPEAVGGVPEDAQIRWEESGNLHRVLPNDPARMAERVRTASAQEIWRRIPVGEDGKRYVAVAGTQADTSSQIAAMALARTAATGDDCRVVMVDLSQQGASHAAGNASGLPGLTDLLDGRVSFAQVLFRDRASRAHIVPRGMRMPVDNDLVDERFTTVLEALSLTYDAVIINIGTLTGGASFAELLIDADHVVLATPGHTADSTVSFAYDMLVQGGIESISVVSTAEMTTPGVDMGLAGAAA